MTQKTRVDARFRIVDGNGQLKPADELSRHLDDVMNELMSLENVIDPDITATLSEGHVEVSVSVDADDDFAAVEMGIAAMRSAVHAAGGFTGTWRMDRQVDVQRWEQLTLT